MLSRFQTLLEELTSALETHKAQKFEDQWVINYPDAGTFSQGVGLSKFDFNTGKILLYDGTPDVLPSTLPNLGLSSLKSLYFWSDVDVDLVFGFKGIKTSHIGYDQCLEFSGIHMPWDYLEIKNDLPGNFQFVGSSSLDPWTTARISTHQMRFASGTATTTQAAVNWQSTDQSGRRSNSKAAYTSPTLHIPNLVRKTFLVFNTDTTNALNVNVQGKGDAGSTNWVDDSSSGASASITAGNSAVFDVQMRYHFMRLRLTAATKTAAFEAHFIGAAP